MFISWPCIAILCAGLFFSKNTLHAQFYDLPTDYSYNLLTARRLAASENPVHAGIQPYIPFFSPDYTHVADSAVVFKFIKDDPLLNKIFYDDLIHIKTKDKYFELKIDPLINFQTGFEHYDSVKLRPRTNTRGFIASGRVGKDFYFETLLAENQSFFPNYIIDVNNATKVVPGQGRWKTFKATGYDYAFSSGLISYQPIKQLNIQLGHGKQKIGYGYRSLLLSDNSFNYPYVRITSQWWKGRLQYTNIYAVLMNLTPASKTSPANTEPLLQKKPAAFQYLSFNATKWLNIGLFQGLIWQTGDSLNRQHLNWEYFNPVIYTNLAPLGLHNKNNLLIGGDICVRLPRRMQLYGQWMLDDLSNTLPSGKGWGYQAGFRAFDALGIRQLFFQLEYNDLSEASYKTPGGTTTNQSYSHYNQNLAFTPNYGKEVVVVADYKIERFNINMKYNHQAQPLNNGPYTTIDLYNASLAYVINPAYNLNLALGFTYRDQHYTSSPLMNNTTSYFYIGLRTSLYNTYYDF